jgi:hypothetical protein
VFSAELSGVPGQRTNDNFFVFNMGGNGFPDSKVVKKEKRKQ